MDSFYYRQFFRITGIVLLLFLSHCDQDKTYQLKTEIVRLKSPDQIVMITKPVVKPILYTHVSGFEKLAVDNMKAKFISVVLPSILIARFEISQARKKIKAMQDRRDWSKKDSLFYLENKSRYHANGISDLLVRMNTLPVSIVLAQAAMESGWGRSRIFIKANNIFGVWSFNTQEPRIAALVKRGNRRIYLRSYSDLCHSVTNYFEILGRAKSFEKLREVLATTSDPMSIVPHLKNYSEHRTAYTNQLRLLITKNNLKKYDHFVIDPSYISMQ